MEEKRSRHRLPISCAQCRRRKRKCDRQTPCHTCLHRGEADQCSYESPVEPHPSSSVEDVRSDNYVLRERIRRLEETIHRYALLYDEPIESPDLQSDRPYSTESSDSYQTASLLGPGSLALDDGISQRPVVIPSHYKSQTSWDHILKELNEIKDVLGIDLDGMEPQEADQENLVECGPYFAPDGQTFQSLFAVLPSKGTMDALLSQYFNSYHPFVPIIVPISFKREYQAFLANPTDPVMLSQLFGMMALALVNGDVNDKDADVFVKASLQALQLSQFHTHFNLTTIVCLINIMSFLRRERAQETFTWVLFGTTVQFARAMGLHRDPLHFGITGQECQTRRHIWAALLAMDTIHAARYGRTTIIDPDEWDSKAPDALNDEGNRISDPIPSAFARAKRSIAMTTARLFKILFRPRTRPSYQTILDADRDVRIAHTAIPRCLTEDVSRASGNLQSVQWLFSRYSPIVMAYTLIIIHRPFIIKKTSEYFQSRITCLESARVVLNILSEMAARPGLDHYTWYVREHRRIACVPAATLLCIGLHIKQNASFEPLPAELDTSDDAADCRLIEEVINSLPETSPPRKIVNGLYQQLAHRSRPTEQQDFGMGENLLLNTQDSVGQLDYWSHDQQAPEVSDRRASAHQWLPQGPYNHAVNHTHFRTKSQPQQMPYSAGDYAANGNNIKWSQSTESFHTQPYKSEQSQVDFDPSLSAYWNELQPH